MSQTNIGKCVSYALKILSHVSDVTESDEIGKQEFEELEKAISLRRIKCISNYASRGKDSASPIDTNNDPFFRSLYGMFKSARNNEERSELINQSIYFLKKPLPKESRKFPSYHINARAGYVFQLLNKVLNDFNIKLTSSQTVDLLSFYFENFSVGEGICFFDVERNATEIINRSLPSVKLNASKISSKLKMVGIRKKIFDNFLIFTNDSFKFVNEDNKDIFKYHLQFAYKLFRILEPNKHAFYLRTLYVIPCSDFLETCKPSEKKLQTIFLVYEPHIRNENMLSRLFEEFDIRDTHEERFVATLVHEYQHILQEANPKIYELTGTIFSKIQSPQDKIDFLGDYTPLSEDSEYAPNPHEFGAVYSEAIFKDTDTALGIALERAGLGSYTSLAMVLLTIGSLSPDENFVNFFSCKTIDGKFSFSVEKINKKDLLKMIPAEYLSAIKNEYHISAEELLDLGIVL